MDLALIVLVLSLLALLLGLPAIILGARRLAERHRERQEDQRREAAEAATQARAEAALNTQRWRVNPQRMVATALLVFRAHVRAPVEGELAMCEHNRTARIAELEQASSRVPGGLRNSSTLQLVALGCLVALPVLLVVESVLDYRIFQGMFSGGGWPVLMAIVYVLALAVFTLGLSVLCGMHGRLNLSHYWRIVLTLVAASLLVGTAGLLINIAPNRSWPTKNHAVIEATYRLDQIKNSLPAQPDQLQKDALGKAEADLVTAKKSRDQAAMVDRVSAGVVAATEPALVEGSVFGILLALVLVRQYRVRRAERDVQEAKNELSRVDLLFPGEIGPLLVAADHGPEEIQPGVALANQAWGIGGQGALSGRGSFPPGGERGTGPDSPPQPPPVRPEGPGAGSAVTPPSWQDEDEAA